MLHTANPAGPMVLADLHTCTLDGTDYVFRTPDVHDPARAARLLTRQRVRRPSAIEFRVAGAAGIAAMAEAARQPEEGERQAGLWARFHELAVPIGEDSLDEPDVERRAALLKLREGERQAELAAIWPQIEAIEGNLERHWQPYADLKADRDFWDAVSRVEIVRLLLVARDGASLPRDDDALVTQDAYKAIPRPHREPLATFALRLIAPDEDQRKN